MQIYIRRDNEEFGPYSREAALEYLKQGIFKTLDDACYAGMTEWKTVGELLGIAVVAKPGRGGAPRNATQITEFNPSWVESAVHREPRKPRKKGAFMLVLNLALVLIVVAAAYARWSTGSHLGRYYLAIVSDEIAKLANEAQDKIAAPAAAPASAPTPAPAPAAPAIAKVPAAASSSTPELAAAATPAPVAAAIPAPATASSPAPAASAMPAPVAALPSAPDAASSPALTAASPAASTPALAVASTPAPAAASPPDASSTPALAVAPVATSAPAVAATPAPPVVSAPAPPKPFDPADLAGIPSAWPKTLRLKQAVVFPVVINSQVAGSVTVPPGTPVTMTGIQGDQLTLQYQGQTQTLPWKETDIAEQVAKAASVAPPAPSVPAAPATAPATAWPPASAPGATASAAAGTPLGN
jgi:hypothetical protein